MSKEILSDDQVEAEIAALRDSEYVRLAQYEQRMRNRRRKYLYQLRWLERKGQELAKNGVTFESLSMLEGQDQDDAVCQMS